MIKELASKILNIPSREFSRTFYAWLLKFIFFTGVTIGWTVVTATVVARLGIGFLPYLLLFDAIFTVGGMFIFSVIAEKWNARNLVAVSTVISVLMLVIAGYFYKNNLLFLTFALLANGVFMSQAFIFLSNFIEEIFSPDEAERTFPLIESSETIGALLAGIFLAVFGMNLLSRDIFFIWSAILLVFLISFLFFKPDIPHDLLKLDNREQRIKSRTRKFEVNSIYKSLENIKKMPFLQVLTVVLALNWVLSVFIEYSFTKAVDENLHAGTHIDIEEYEKLLTHGLGVLHVMIHGGVLFFEVFLANRIMVKIGTYGSFMLHGLLSLLGVITSVIGGGFAGTVIMKNNYSISGKLQKSAYENMYYAFGEDMQKSMREFIEGVLYPVSIVAGTLVIIGMQALFLDEHFNYFISLAALFLVSGLILFTAQMKNKYTRQNLHNLQSGDIMTSARAVNILVQKGHKRTIEALLNRYKTTDDMELRRIIAHKLRVVPARRAVKALIAMYNEAADDEKSLIVKSICSMTRLIKKKSSLIPEVLRIFYSRLSEEVGFAEKTRIMVAIGELSGKSFENDLCAEDYYLRAVYIERLFKRKNKRSEAIKTIDEMLKSEKSEHLWTIVFLNSGINYKPLKMYVKKRAESERGRDMAPVLLAALNSGYNEYLAGAVSAMLFSEDDVFVKCLEAAELLPEKIRSRLRAEIASQRFYKLMPETTSGKNMEFRIDKLLSVLETDDGRDLMSYNVNSAEPVFGII